MPGNNLTSQINNTQHMSGRAGHRRYLGTPQDFLHMQHINAVSFIAEYERQPLRLRIVGVL